MQRPAATEPEEDEQEPSTAADEDPSAAALELDDYNELEAEEIIALLGSMERRQLEALRVLESDARARTSVLHAIDSVLARAPAAG